MPQINKKTIFLLIGSICAFVIFIVLADLLYNYIQAQGASIKSAKIAIVVLEDKEKDLINAKNNLELLKEDITKIDQAFLSEASFVTFLKLLEALAQKSGVIFQAENADLPRSSDGKAELNFMVRGDYPSLIKFFSLLDQIPYSGIIDQVSISPDSTKNSTLIVRARYVVFNFISQQ
ncbi:MAG: hypothetical protein AAB795_01480 [Patescibacteria group bacterium]